MRLGLDQVSKRRLVVRMTTTRTAEARQMFYCGYAVNHKLVKSSEKQGSVISNKDFIRRTVPITVLQQLKVTLF